MNKQLRAIYKPALVKLSHTLSGIDGLSCPLLLHAPEAYHQAATKLMIVGQETYGWGNKDTSTVDTLMTLYLEFDLGRQYYRSPFWQAAHTLHCNLNPDGPEHAFLWSNLVKIDQWRTRPSPDVEASISQLGLLQQEIAVTCHDVVVFFTGPRYETRLQSSFRKSSMKRSGLL